MSIDNPTMQPLARADIAQAFAAITLDIGAAGPSAMTARPMSDNLVAAVIVAELLQMPLQNATAIKRVGRLMWVSFHPINYPDPEMIVALPGHASRHFNRVALDFLEVRERGPRDPRRWYAEARRAMLRFIPALALMDAAPEEENFVLEWAADIVAHMRTLPRPASPWRALLDGW